MSPRPPRDERALRAVAQREAARIREQERPVPVVDRPAAPVADPTAAARRSRVLSRFLAERTPRSAADTGQTTPPPGQISPVLGRYLEERRGGRIPQFATDLGPTGLADLPPNERIIEAISRGYDIRLRQAQAVAEQAAEETQEREIAAVQADVEALAGQRPEDVRNWRTLARNLIRAHETAPDDETRQSVQAMLHQYQARLRPHINIIDANWWDENYVEPEDPAAWQRLLGAGLQAVDPVLDHLMIPGQAVLSGLRGVTGFVQGDLEADDAARHVLGEGLKAGAWVGTASAAALVPGVRELMEPARGIQMDDGRVLRVDLDEDEIINFREALGLDPDAGGRVAGLFDTIGQVLFDPITYMTLGAGVKARAAKFGLRAAAGRDTEVAGGAAVADRIIHQVNRQGWKSLDEADRTLAEKWIRESVVSMGEAASKNWDDMTLRQKWSHRRFREMDRIAKLEDKLARERIGAVRRGGRTGIHLAGFTVVPFGPAADVLRRVGLLDTVLFTTRRVQEPVEQVAEAAIAAGMDDLAETLRQVPLDRRAAAQARLDDALRGTAGEAPIPVGDRLELPPGPPPDPDWRFYDPAFAARVLDEQLGNEFLTPAMRTKLQQLADRTDVAGKVVNFVNEGGVITRAAEGPEGYVVRHMGQEHRIPFDEMSGFLAGLSDEATAFFRHYFPDLQPALPPARRDVIEEMVRTGFVAARTGELVEQGFVAQRVTGVAGELVERTPRTIRREELAREQRLRPRRKNLPVRGEPGSPQAPWPGKPPSPPLPVRWVEPLDEFGQPPSRDPVWGWQVGPEGEVTAVSGARYVLMNDVWREAVARQSRLPVRWVDEETGRALPDPVPRVEPPRVLPPGVPVPELPAWRQRALPPGVPVLELPAARIMEPPETTIKWVDREIPYMKVIPGAFTNFLDSPFMMVLRRALVPRAAVRARHGAQAARRVEQVSAEAIATLNADYFDAMTQLGHSMGRGGLAKRAIKDEFDGDETAWLRQLNKALAHPLDYQMVYDESGPIMQLILDNVTDVRLRIYNATVRAGADPDMLRNAFEYIPRYLSPKARETIENIYARDPTGVMARLLEERGIRTPEGQALTRREQVILDMSRHRGHLRERKLATDADDLIRVNDEWEKLAQENGLLDAHPEMARLFIENPLEAFALRARDAFRAQMEVDIAKGLAAETSARLGRGSQLAYFADTKDQIDRIINVTMPAHGVDRIAFVETKLHNGGAYWIHRDIWDELETVRKIIGDPKHAKGFARVYDQGNNLWAAYATVPLIGLGYFARNTMGNLFNAYLGGLWNPFRYHEALKTQATWMHIQRVMRVDGLSYDDAAKKINADPKVARIADQARRHGVIAGAHTGMIADIFEEQVVRTGVTLADSVNPVNMNNVILRPGRALGTFLEENARMALFIDQLRKGAGVSDAAAHVRNFLFDYSDLTRFEVDKLRRISRFYTWMRKNTALQAKMLAAYPAGAINTDRIATAFAEFVTDDPEAEPGSIIFPEWTQELGMLFRAPAFGGGIGMVGVDTPFRSAVNTVYDLISATMLIPGLEHTMPQHIREIIDDRTDRAQRAMALFSGVAPSFVQLLYGERFEADPFSRRSLRDETANQWIRLGSVLFPVLNKVERELRLTGIWGEEDDKGSLSFRLLNSTTGLMTFELTEDQQGRALAGLNKEVGDSLTALREAGVDVPTIEELREAGQLNFRNRLMEAMAYPWDSEGNLALDAKLLEMVPKDVLDAFGLGHFKEEPVREADLDRDVWNAEQVLGALEAWIGRPLDPDERTLVMLQLPSAPGVRELEAIGIEPWRENRFLPEGERAGPTTEDTIERLNRIGEVYGLDASTIARMRPLLPEADRIVRDGLAAGMTNEQIRDHFVEAYLNRTERAYIFGTDDIDMFNPNRRITPEEARKIQNRTWQREAELRVIYKLYGWGEPPIEDVMRYTTWLEMNVGDQEALGLPRQPRVPARRDARPPELIAEDRTNELQAILRGIEQGPPLDR